jgi:hypothetical protein
MEFELEIQSGPQTGKKIALQPNVPFSIGRVRGNVLFPDDWTMSGLHFEVATDGARVQLKNHSQTNGTLVNGELCVEKRLQVGDVVSAGNTKFALRAVNTPAPTGINGWIFDRIPSGWEIVPEQGLRRIRKEERATTLLASEDKLPEGFDFNGYVQIQLTLFSERSPTSEATRTPGGLIIRTALPDKRIALQKQRYAMSQSKVGILTATAFESDPSDVHAQIDQLLASAQYKPGSNKSDGKI